MWDLRIIRHLASARPHITLAFYLNLHKHNVNYLKLSEIQCLVFNINIFFYLTKIWHYISCLSYCDVPVSAKYNILNVTSNQTIYIILST